MLLMLSSPINQDIKSQVKKKVAQRDKSSCNN